MAPSRSCCSATSRWRSPDAATDQPMDLIQRAAERLKRNGELNLVELAAAKLASVPAAPATAEPSVPAGVGPAAEPSSPAPPVAPATATPAAPPIASGTRPPGPYVTLDLGKL